MKIDKRTAAVGFAVLLLVGGGSAAVLDYFAQSTGDATVNNQAISSSNAADYSYDEAAPPSVFVEQVDLTNNNDKSYERVAFKSVVSEGDSTTGQTVSVQDLDETQILTDTGVELQVEYNTGEDEVEITPTQVSSYDGGVSGVVFGFDIDNDGRYDFQVDTAASDAQPDLYEYDDQSTGTGDFVEHHDYTQNNVETNGVHFTDSSTKLEGKNSFTLTVDVERVGSSFSVNAEQDGSSFLTDLTAGNAVQTSPGQEVTGSQDIINGGETRTYGVITELDSGAESGSYSTAVNFNPVTE